MTTQPKHSFNAYAPCDACADPNGCEKAMTTPAPELEGMSNERLLGKLETLCFTSSLKNFPNIEGYASLHAELLRRLAGKDAPNTRPEHDTKHFEPVAVQPPRPSAEELAKKMWEADARPSVIAILPWDELVPITKERWIQWAARALAALSREPGNGCSKVILPDDVDKECVPLCNAINSIPGLRTISSCCGHGERPFSIWFVVDEMRGLARLLEPVEPCESCNPLGITGWGIKVESNAGSGVTFVLNGPLGKYDEADKIAMFICRVPSPPAEPGKEKV